MKERFTTEPVLVTSDLDREMRVEVDVSDFAMGGVLSMKCKDERWRPVVKIVDSGLHFYFLFSLYFIFIFIFILFFYF